MRILVIDDEQSQRRELGELLTAWGHQPEPAASVKEVLAWSDQRLALCDVAIVDKQLDAGEDGLELAPMLIAKAPDLQLIMLTAFGTIEYALKSKDIGFATLLQKPLVDSQLRTALEKLKPVCDAFAVAKSGELVVGAKRLVGRSERFRKAVRDALRVAPTGAGVLLTGGSGTGKELFARLIHEKSPRAKKAFIDVNCAAVPEELIESQLFGHEKGAFTGATTKQIGKFQRADGGTLFLDEVADMSQMTQAKVLRALQERIVEPLGSATTVKVDVRVIAATNKGLESEIAGGRFREDLFFRLSVVPIELPSLAERAEDIPFLAQHFLTKFAREQRRSIRGFSAGALELLTRHTWRGNVRELENCLERAVAMHMGSGEIIASDIVLNQPVFATRASVPLSADIGDPSQAIRLAARIVSAIKDAVHDAPVTTDAGYKVIKAAITRCVREAVAGNFVRLDAGCNIQALCTSAIEIAWDDLCTDGVRWLTEQSRSNKTERQRVLAALVAKELDRLRSPLPGSV